MSEDQRKAAAGNVVEIRCLKDTNFFNLMKKKTVADCARSITEQISTEELVKQCYSDFIESRADDPE